MARVIDGRFELLSPLGGGGMGRVWRARDLVLHREVAIKEVRPPDPGLAEYDAEAALALRARVLREARALARIADPHVVTIHHIVDDGEHTYPWLVMELVPGGSLQDRLDHGVLAPAQAARIGRGVLAGLRAAHAADIQHRDIKPANILLRPDGRPALTDFGIAAIQGSTVLTAAGALIGTPDYMAPERVAGEDGGPAADLWSLAMTLYVCVEGRNPLRRANTLATLAAVLGEDVPPPRSAGPLTRALTSVLVRDPHARPGPETLDQLLTEAEHAPPTEAAASTTWPGTPTTPTPAPSPAPGPAAAPSPEPSPPAPTTGAAASTAPNAAPGMSAATATGPGIPAAPVTTPAPTAAPPTATSYPLSAPHPTGSQQSHAAPQQVAPSPYPAPPPPTPSVPSSHPPAPPHPAPHLANPLAPPVQPAPAPPQSAAVRSRRRWAYVSAIGAAALAGVLLWTLLPRGDGSGDDKAGGEGTLPRPGTSGAPGGATATDPRGPSGGKKITIGIKFDQPGLGLKTPSGDYTGFDVDVARYIAEALGHAPADIEWKEVPSAERENVLRRGDVDFVVASYAITDARKQRVDFAGPYLEAHQDVLLRAKDPSIRTVADLNDKKLCSVTGSSAALSVRQTFAPQTQLETRASIRHCLADLAAGAVDAVTSDDAILAGYAAHEPGDFKLGGFKLTHERYGIGLPKGSAQKGKVQQALKRMVADGSWDRAVRKHLPLLRADAPAQ